MGSREARNREIEQAWKPGGETGKGILAKPGRGILEAGKHGTWKRQNASGYWIVNFFVTVDDNKMMGCTQNLVYHAIVYH